MLLILETLWVSYLYKLLDVLEYCHFNFLCYYCFSLVSFAAIIVLITMPGSQGTWNWRRLKLCGSTSIKVFSSTPKASQQLLILPYDTPKLHQQLSLPRPSQNRYLMHPQLIGFLVLEATPAAISYPFPDLQNPHQCRRPMVIEIWSRGCCLHCARCFYSQHNLRKDCPNLEKEDQGGKDHWPYCPTFVPSTITGGMFLVIQQLKKSQLRVRFNFF